MKRINKLLDKEYKDKFIISCEYTEDSNSRTMKTDTNKKPNKYQAQAIINELLKYAGDAYRIDFK